jgi:putative transposase
LRLSFSPLDTARAMPDARASQRNASGKEYRLSRPPRLDFHGAIHLVRMRGKEGFNIYFDASVLERASIERPRAEPCLSRFFGLLDLCCLECGEQLFGYCIEPNDASWVMRTLGAPLETFMQRLGGRYSRYIHLTDVLPKRVCAFAGRYGSKVVAPEYLPHALRRVHARPLRTGLARRAIDYPFSSAAAYLGERAPVRLQTDAVWRALERKGMAGIRGYREFMEKAETGYVAELFEQGSPLDARVVGGSVFVAQARDAAKHRSAPLTREQLLTGVAQLLGTESEAVFTVGHQVVLARALVASYALRSGTASLREVGRWFGVSAATLGKAVRHHRRASPALFEEVLPGMEPEDLE